MVFFDHPGGPLKTLARNFSHLKYIHPVNMLLVCELVVNYSFIAVLYKWGLGVLASSLQVPGKWVRGPANRPSRKPKYLCAPIFDEFKRGCTPEAIFCGCFDPIHPNLQTQRAPESQLERFGSVSNNFNFIPEAFRCLQY